MSSGGHIGSKRKQANAYVLFTFNCCWSFTPGSPSSLIARSLIGGLHSSPKRSATHKGKILHSLTNEPSSLTNIVGATSPSFVRWAFSPIEAPKNIIRHALLSSVHPPKWLLWGTCPQDLSPELYSHYAHGGDYKGWRWDHVPLYTTP